MPPSSLGHYGHAVAADVLELERCAEALAQYGADLGETEVLLDVGGHCFSADSGVDTTFDLVGICYPKTPAEGNCVPDFSRFSVVR
jgi:hypothetical protein